MARLFNRQIALGASVLAGAMLIAAGPVEAQARMKVLVPGFANSAGEVTRDGDRLAGQVRDQIDDMPTHQPVKEDDWKNALKKHDLDQKEMDCLKWQQLARVETAMEVGLVLCGTYEPTTQQVSGNFSPVGGGDPFAVPAFAFQTREQAAQQVVQAFQTYIRQLSLLRDCDDYIRSQAWDQALTSCNEAVQLNPRSASAHYARGSALLNLDRKEEALAAFQQVLGVDQLNTDALLAAGYTAAQLDQQEVSQKYFHDYLAMNPGDVQVRLTIATRLANEGDPSGALRLVEEATQGADAGGQLFRYAGHFAMNAGLDIEKEGGQSEVAAREAMPFFQKAVTNYERSLQLEPDSAGSSLLTQLMLAYSNVGNNAKALEIGQRAVAVGTDQEKAQALSIQAEVLKDAGQIEQAVAALDRAAQLDPTIANLAGRKGVLLLEAGDLSGATAAFKQAVAQGSLPPEQAENIAQSMAVKGYNATQARNFSQSMPFYEAARQLGKSERTIAMINFFNGYTLIKQAEPIIVDGNNAAAARQAKPMFERARTLLQQSAAYTEQAKARTDLIAQIGQFILVADALIAAGR
ncbi:MAG: tetratricopeptide repeat protein [Gemmatimonadota bacterium]